MVTNRRPFSRTRQPPFPPEALTAFREMARIEGLAEFWPPSSQSEPALFRAWADQHEILHRALGCKPWQWWCVQPPSVEGQESEYSEDARQRWLALAQAAGIALEGLRG
jgi:hypothetical protein